MTTTITFQFSIDQELHTPHGQGYVAAMGLFWQPDGGQRIRYYVDLDNGKALWIDEAELLRCNRRIFGLEPKQVSQQRMILDDILLP